MMQITTFSRLPGTTRLSNLVYWVTLALACLVTLPIGKFALDHAVRMQNQDIAAVGYYLGSMEAPIILAIGATALFLRSGGATFIYGIFWLTTFAPRLLRRTVDIDPSLISAVAMGSLVVLGGVLIYLVRSGELRAP